MNSLSVADVKSLAVDAGHDADGGGCGVDDDDVRYDGYNSHAGDGGGEAKDEAMTTTTDIAKRYGGTYS